MYCSRNINNQWRKIFLLSTCEGSYRVVGCLSVRIQAIETVDNKHSNHAASVCQHILLLSKTHTHTHIYKLYCYIKKTLEETSKGQHNITSYVDC